MIIPEDAQRDVAELLPDLLAFMRGPGQFGSRHADSAAEQRRIDKRDALVERTAAVVGRIRAHAERVQLVDDLRDAAKLANVDATDTNDPGEAGRLFGLAERLRVAADLLGRADSV